jgi:hypothetical protein
VEFNLSALRHQSVVCSGSLQYMPYTNRLLRNEGAEFRHAYVTTPMCCPSRSSLLTGMLVHNHQAICNNSLLFLPPRANHCPCSHVMQIDFAMTRGVVFYCRSSRTMTTALETHGKLLTKPDRLLHTSQTKDTELVLAYFLFLSFKI